MNDELDEGSDWGFVLVVIFVLGLGLLLLTGWAWFLFWLAHYVS